MGLGETDEQLGKEQDLLGRVTHPTTTIVSGDESAMNFREKPTSQSTP